MHGLPPCIACDDFSGLSIAIKLANSALFRGGGPVDRVLKAVARLGIRNILYAVVAVSPRGNVTPAVPAQVLEQFWDRAGVLALAASLTVRKVHGVAPDMANSYAIFHDSAMSILKRRFPYYGKAMSLDSPGGQVARENEDFQCNHPNTSVDRFFALEKPYGG